jgi:SAM-dependent methyltransferase
VEESGGEWPDGAARGQVPSGIDRGRCRFIEGDACNMLALELGTFDAVMAANLMCRVPDPSKFLRDVHVLVKPGGVFVLVSPYSWLPEYTGKDKCACPASSRRAAHRCSERRGGGPTRGGAGRVRWVGGYNKEGQAVYSKEEVKRLLSGGSVPTPTHTAHAPGVPRAARAAAKRGGGGGGGGWQLRPGDGQGHAVSHPRAPGARPPPAPAPRAPRPLHIAICSNVLSRYVRLRARARARAGL